MSVYSALLKRRGARALALACISGWVTFASSGLAIVLLVEHRTGSFAAAGAAVAAFSAGAGVLAPFRGRLIDSRGAPVLVAFGAGHAAGLVLVIVAPSGVATVLAAGFAGAVAPPLIATARTVWPVVAGPELTRAAHALNALLGDAASVLGPAATGAFVAWLGAPAALALLAFGPFAGTVIVARVGVPRRGIGPGEARHGALGALRTSAGLRTLVVVDVWLGMAIGAVDVAAPALAAEESAPELAAIPLAAFAAGSVAASLWAGQARSRAQRRFVAGCVLLSVALAGCAFVSSVIALAAVLLFAGAAYGVLNVALFELLDVVVPPRNAVEALTWLTTAGGIGIAAGAAIAGQLAADSPESALLLTAIATVPGAVLALARRRSFA
jgi:predicted MFS family arabinose efflux permease